MTVALKFNIMLKIATFNANSIRSRLHIIEKWLEKEKPDILAIQETKVVDELFPKSAFEEWGYNVVFRGKKAYSGVAIASKWPIEDVEYGFDEDPRDEERLIKAVIKGIPIVNTYVPQGKKIDHPDYQYKLWWFRRLRDYFSRKFSPDEPLLWVGDLNVAPTELDVTNPKTKKNHVDFHIDVRKEFQKTLEWGFVDVFRKHRPGPGEFTFWDYRVPKALERNIGWRVDHILATKPLADKSVDAYVDREPRAWPKPSDHTFLVAIFDVDC